jgi:hypothetical protein
LKNVNRILRELENLFYIEGESRWDLSLTAFLMENGKWKMENKNKL